MARDKDNQMGFYTNEGKQIPGLTTEQMREVDRIAVDDFELGLLQMMENAGRNLAQHAISYLEGQPGAVTVLAGPGGNGGGGICCARHLHNHGVEVSILLSKPVENVGKSARIQLTILENSGIQPLNEDQFDDAILQSALVIDAIIGYNLQGAPRGKAAELINLCNTLNPRVISLDVPSGMDSTTGDILVPAIKSEATLTLALPKTGLDKFEGDLFLADIGIPPEVYLRLGIELDAIFEDQYVIPIHSR
jgi:NAD(P)H-hydrate epimerase